MFVSIYLPLPPPPSDGDKKQSDFSCMEARKAVYLRARARVLLNKVSKSALLVCVYTNFRDHQAFGRQSAVRSHYLYI